MSLDDGAPAPVLAVNGLSVDYRTATDAVSAVSDVHLALNAGTITGIAGESGSGKSTLARALIRLIKPPGLITAGEIFFKGHDLLRLSEAQMRALRGRDIGLIRQDPLDALNPCFTVGWQIDEVFKLHAPDLRTRGGRHIAEMLAMVGIPPSRAGAYPHELSGGMRQRVMIGMAIATSPALLIADEPTTALDVTVQAQILDLLLELVHQSGMAAMFISHDLGVLRQIVDQLALMYAGRIVEAGPVDQIVVEPLHPYTWTLLRAVPEVRGRRRYLITTPGEPGRATNALGCVFAHRCPFAEQRCHTERPLLRLIDGRAVACHLAPAVREHFDGRAA
jgi:oligopeptide/dipeptide ABC transporter ATP-binding protein